MFRRTTGVWYIRKSHSHPYADFSTWITQTWGNSGDQTVPADYYGDGKDDYAIWRAKTGVWWIVYSGNSSINTFELGVQGDVAVPSAYLKQVNGSVPIDELAAERLKPRNATGGANLYSQNFSWGRELVSLPGREGLDLSLGISYNSLVWTKAGGSGEIYFDLDSANVSPGFKLGFPTIEPVYFDEEKGKFAYLMVTGSGARVQFRETTVSGVYETADSTYTQLETAGASDPNDPVEGNDRLGSISFAAIRSASSPTTPLRKPRLRPSAGGPNSASIVRALQRRICRPSMDRISPRFLP